MADVRLVAFGSEEYRAALCLREEILRTPLGLPLSAEDVARDSECLHAVAVEEGQIVGYLLALPLGEDCWKLRQVAVLESMQGKGVGRALTLHMERELKKRRARNVTLNAREAAIPFYEKLGYCAVGEFFIEKKIISARRMEKDIS